MGATMLFVDPLERAVLVGDLGSRRRGVGRRPCPRCGRYLSRLLG